MNLNFKHMNRPFFSKNTGLLEQKQNASSIQPINNLVRTKKALTVIVALSISFALSAQDPDTLNTGNKSSDTTNFMLGKKEIRIVEKDGETDIKVRNRNQEEKVNSDDENEESNDNIEDNDNDNNYDSWNNDRSYSWSSRKSNKNFKGHWDAFQIGVNSYLSADKSTSIPKEYDFMSLNTNKSINVNINMFQQSFGLVGKRFGVVSGLGLEFSNYVFEGDNTIAKDGSGNIVSKDPGFKLDKSKLTTSYLTVPLLLEYQFPGDRRSNRLFINAGVIGGLKLGSHTKIKYKENGDKQTRKEKDDFNLNVLRYGFTGRIGIKHLSIYGTYYPVSLFEKDKNPELYPFMVGFSFDGF